MDCKGILTPILRTWVLKSTLLLQNRGHAEVLKKDPFFLEIRNEGAAPLGTWVPPPPPPPPPPPRAQQTFPGSIPRSFLVAKESGGWRPILNLKAFNKFVKPPPFRMETLCTVMDWLGEAHQQRLKTSEHFRDSSMSETWAVSMDLRDAYLVERQRDLTLFWVNKLDFLVNEGKSQLIPTQFPAFLWSTLDLINMLIFPGEKRVVKVSLLGPGESRLAGFMIPVFSTTDDGAWSEVWVPLRPP